jgi:hypothetical protein
VLYFKQRLICHLLSASYFCRLCLLKVHMESSSLLLPPSLVHSKHPAFCAACPFQFLAYYLLLFFFVGWGSVCPGSYADLSQGWLGMPHAAYLLTCWSVSLKQVWSWHLAAWETSCFFSVTSHGEALWGLGAQGVIVFLILSGYFSAKHGSSISERFFIYGAHAVCFLLLVAIFCIFILMQLSLITYSLF